MVERYGIDGYESWRTTILLKTNDDGFYKEPDGYEKTVLSAL